MKAVTHAIIYDIILGIIHVGPEHKERLCLFLTLHLQLAVDSNLVYHYFTTVSLIQNICQST